MSINAVNMPAAQPQKKTGGAGKALASAFVPGLGQFLDGRNKEGAEFMVTSTAVSGAGLALFLNKCKVSKLPKVKSYALAVFGMLTPIVWLTNIIDAFIGERKKA